MYCYLIIALGWESNCVPQTLYSGTCNATPLQSTPLQFKINRCCGPEVNGTTVLLIDAILIKRVDSCCPSARK